MKSPLSIRVLPVAVARCGAARALTAAAQETAPDHALIDALLLDLPTHTDLSLVEERSAQ